MGIEIKAKRRKPTNLLGLNRIEEQQQQKIRSIQE